MNDFVIRRAASSYRLSKDDNVLNGMIDQMNKTTAQASAAIDKALAFVDASNKRIEVMERSRGTESRLMGVTDKTWDALTTVIMTY